MCLNFKVRGCAENTLAFTAPLLSFLLSPPFLHQSSGFINETETCVSTNEEAVNNLEKSQCNPPSSHLMIESLTIRLFVNQLDMNFAILRRTNCLNMLAF